MEIITEFKVSLVIKRFMNIINTVDLIKNFGIWKLEKKSCSYLLQRLLFMILVKDNGYCSRVSSAVQKNK